MSIINKLRMWNVETKGTILIVDDDEVMILLLKKLFEKKYTVFTASDGVEAMHHLSKGLIPDLIISDILMENINGYEFIRHLKTSFLYKNIPIVILSIASKTEISQHLPSPIVVNKPFDPIQLKKVVDANIFKNYDITVM